MMLSDTQRKCFLELRLVSINMTIIIPSWIGWVFAIWGILQIIALVVIFIFINWCERMGV